LVPNTAGDQKYETPGETWGFLFVPPSLQIPRILAASPECFEEKPPPSEFTLSAVEGRELPCIAREAGRTFDLAALS